METEWPTPEDLVAAWEQALADLGAVRDAYDLGAVTWEQVEIRRQRFDTINAKLHAS